MTTAPSETLQSTYDRNGYWVVHDVLHPDEVSALLERAREYTHGGRPPGHIYMQTEPRVERGELRVEHPGDAIRKIEGLVTNDDLFAALARHERILEVIEVLLGPDIKLFRDALMQKPPQVGSAKGMHQDSPYWPIEPMALCSVWLALDEATAENGCMTVLPGQHRRGPLPHVNVTDDYIIEEGMIDESDAVLVPLPPGGGLFFHSLLPHGTAPNHSTRWRRAMVLSYMSARSLYTGEGDGPVYVHIQGRGYPGCVR